MFKLESYITPLIMGYLDKYVKLRHEDFQLSLWGGDAVLNNLDLRLDELEKIVQLPVMFQSGHIHELRLHVPWTKLGSEPVVITINTVECIVKVRDTAYEMSSSGKSGNSPAKSSHNRQKSKRQSQTAEDLPPGYLQSLVSRIVNNVSFVINNLILKFVEDDIVLSVNIKSAECYSVDKEWNRAFVELTPHDLALRKVVNFADLTVCLDKTNASGHIESYQEPMAYRCAVTCRFHMEYDSVSAKLPKTSRLNVYCEQLNLTMTDTQLPMFIRLVQLCIAIYYGTLDIPSAPETRDSSVDPANVASEESKVGELAPPEQAGEGDQGWASWAWSYVPQILPEEEEEVGEEGQEGGERRRQKAAALVLSLGFYVHKGTIVFKLTEKSRESTDLPHKKIHFHPFLKLDLEGAGTEILLQGLEFFSVQCGFTAFKIKTVGECICGIQDEDVERCNTLLSGGASLDQKVGLNYLSNSLFDDMSWENRGERSQHITDGDQHKVEFTEQYALQRFGAFWMDQLYTMDKPDGFLTGSNSSETNNSDSVVFIKEFSNLRFLFGNTHLQYTSTLYHRLAKVIACASNHQYQPYGSGRQDMDSSNEDRPQPSQEQVQSLEEFIPTNILHLTLINPTVTMLIAEHPYCDVAKKNFKTREKKAKKENQKKAQTQQNNPTGASSLPGLTIAASRFDLQVTKPMYPGRLVKMVTAIAGPSSNLLHHCHSHTQIKLFSLQAGLQRFEEDGRVSHRLTLLPPCSFALYSRSLQIPKLWSNSSLAVSEWMYEVPNLSFNISKASILLLSGVFSSWFSPHSPCSPSYLEKSQSTGARVTSVYNQVLADSLLDDLFPLDSVKHPHRGKMKPTEQKESAHHTFPSLEVGLCGLEFKSCKSKLVDAWTGGLSSLHVLLYTPGIGGKMSAVPIVYGPSDTSNICSTDFFSQPTLKPAEMRSDCITATLQIPQHSSITEAQALALIDCQGVCVWLDPGLVSWFHYCPQPRPGTSSNSDQPAVTLDLSLAQMTSPLNAVSQASVHSTSTQSQSRGQVSTPRAPTTPSPRPVDGAAADQPEAKGDHSMGHTLAQWFPLLRLLHLQVDLKPSAIFLPKTSIPAQETSPDILSLVHQARQGGRLADTLVVCLPSVSVCSTMAKPVSIVQELPVTSIAGSLIGEKLPWTVKIRSMCAYTLLSTNPEPCFLLHPLDIVSTVAVSCSYNPPTSDKISALALCLHVDVEQPQIEITAAQLQVFSAGITNVNSVCDNTLGLLTECSRTFAHSSSTDSLSGGDGRQKAGTEHLLSHAQRDLSGASAHRRFGGSTGKTERGMSAGEEATETNPTTEFSEEFSHEGSPLHESLIEEKDDQAAGIKLSLWLQLMIPSVTASVYSRDTFTGIEHGLSLCLDYVDVSLDSHLVYTKVKLSLGSIGVQHSTKCTKTGEWALWTDPEGIVVSCKRQLPRHLISVSARSWQSDSHSGMQQGFFLSRNKHAGGVSSAVAGGLGSSTARKNNGSSAVSVTFTRAMCKNVKKRMRRANVELSSINKMDTRADKQADAIPEHHNFGDTRDALGAEHLYQHGLGDYEDVEFYFHQYLSEICIKTEPIDIVLKPEVVSVLSNLTSNQGLSSSTSHHHHTAKLRSGVGAPGFEPEGLRKKQMGAKTVNKKSSGVGAGIIPLVYAELGVIRVFVPKSESSTSVSTSVDKALNTTVLGPSHNSDSSFSTVIDIEDSEDFKHDTTAGVVDRKPRSGSGSSGSDSQEKAERNLGVCSTLNHSMIVMQVNACVVQPHADNPLPRVAQEKDLYQKALQAGVTQQLGSVMEDRQYQINVRGLALYTAVWKELVSEAKEEKNRKSPTGSQVQIPALEWNTFLMDNAGKERKEVKLVPLATPFDLCVVMAPPIHFVSKPCDAVAIGPLLICGLALEMNVTSDLDLYLSSHQIKLLAEIAAQFGHAASGGQGQSGKSRSQRLPSTLTAHAENLGPKSDGLAESVDIGKISLESQGGACVDSGVGSDLSVLTSDRRRLVHPPTDTQKSSGGDWEGVRTTKVDDVDCEEEAEEMAGGRDPLASAPPLDVLLTAGRISCTVYTHKILTEDVTIQMPLFGDRQSSPRRNPSGVDEATTNQRAGSVQDNLADILSRQPANQRHADNDDDVTRADGDDEGVDEEETDEGFTSFSFMKPQQGEDNSLKREIPAGSVAVVPFVYLYIVQPHCILVNHHNHYNHGNRNKQQQHQHVGGDAALLSAVSDRERKLEVSCYDILVKGASDRHISAVEEYHVIPVCADFNVHWLETRPGEADQYTGIPPSLMTATIVHQAHKPGVIRLHLGRPVRVKASQLAVEQTCLFAGDLMSALAQPGKDGEMQTEGNSRENLQESHTGKAGFDISTLAERVEVSTSQLVLCLDLDTSKDGAEAPHSREKLADECCDSVGAVMSVEAINAQLEIIDTLSETDMSIRGLVQLKDIVAKTRFNSQQCRPLVGPFSVGVDASITWVTVSPNISIPQISVALDSSVIQVSFGQEHVFCLTKLVTQLQSLKKKIFETNPVPKKGHPDVCKKDINISTTTTRPQPPESSQYVFDLTQDDLRKGSFHFTDISEESLVLPDPYEITFSSWGSDQGGSSHMTWCYPHPRVLTQVILNPVPFCVASQTSGDLPVPDMIPGQLQYWSETSSQFVTFTSISLSENEVTKVTLPDPNRLSDRSELVAARVWRVILGSSSTSPTTETPAVLPASLAACMRVDSALIPSLVPTLQVSVVVSALELLACHHLQYNGRAMLPKLNQYEVCAELVEDQTFAVLAVRNVCGSLTHLTVAEQRSNVKLSGETSLSVVEYGHLTMEQVLPPSSLTLSVEYQSGHEVQNVTACVMSDKVEVRVGRSVVHSLHMATLAWSTFHPVNRGPRLIFNHLIICNNTAVTLRFGQAGTSENVVLHSRQMYGYSWRSTACPEMLHLCLDSPSWKWTEPFSVASDASNTSTRTSRVVVRSVLAPDQSWAVIIKVKHLSGMQTQVTVCGQLLVSNRLSQPISMKICGSQASKDPVSFVGKTVMAGHASISQHKQYTVQPGECLPSLVSNQVMASCVQFRLAGHHTAWSHDIYLSGDQMKDNQMVKIPLPDRSSYFHMWCRVFCQHFHGMPQKMGSASTVTLRMIMLTPLYVVRTHLPRPLHIHLNSPNVPSSQEWAVPSRGREFQLHCVGGDLKHQMAFRLGADMQLSSPPVILSTGLVQQLERTSESGQVDLGKLCDLELDTARYSWPYLEEADGGMIDLDSGDINASLEPSQVSSLGLEGGVLDDEYDLEPQPSVDLQVRLSEYIPGCDTLLVEVAPACLVHNATDMNVLLGSEGSSDSDDNLRWTLTPGATMAPPLPKQSLRMAVKYKNIKSEDKTVPVSQESSDYRRYNDELGKVLFMDSHVHVAFKLIDARTSKKEIAFVTVTSSLQHGIRIICVRERFSLSNRTDLDLDCKLLALPLSPNPLRMSEMEGTRFVARCKNKKGFSSKKCELNGEAGTHKEQNSLFDAEDCIPLYRWSCIDRGDDVPKPKGAQQGDEQTYVCYVSFSMFRGTSSQRLQASEILDNNDCDTYSWTWSVPLRLVSSKDSRRGTVSVPDYFTSDGKMDCHQNPQKSSLEGQSLCDRVNGDGGISPSVTIGDHAAVSQHEVSRPACPAISQALCVTSQQVGGVTHLALSVDATPALVVENLCPFPLQFGQACDVTGISGAVIQEQVELVSDLPWVPAGGWSHYTPPFTNTEFVNKETITLPKLFFRACVKTEDSGYSEWSSPIQIVGNTDAFVQLRGFSDLKVSIEPIGLTTHLVVTPVSKAEISAREIRSRLKGSGHDQVPVATASGGDDLTGKFGASVVKWQKDSQHGGDENAEQLLRDSQTSVSVSQSPLSKAGATLKKALVGAASVTGSNGGKRRSLVSTSVPCERFAEVYKRQKKRKQGARVSISVGLLCEKCSLHLQDETVQNDDLLSPLMAIHLSDLFFGVFPVAHKPGAVCEETSYAVSVGGVQVDNLKYGKGAYDFPVVFLPQKGSTVPSSSDSSFSTLNSELRDGRNILGLEAVMRSSSFSHIRVVTFRDPVWGQSGVESLVVAFKPFSVYVDDTFVYRVLQEVEAFAPSKLALPLKGHVRHRSRETVLARRLPAAVVVNSLVLSHPVCIKHLTVQPIKVLLSVHASVRLFLASDHTPLSLAQFNREQVFTSTQRLIHSLTMHYASAAIFRAGIVVGSLEILGNPTGLVRSIGTGVTDLVSLPYSGLTQGPSAFIGGLSRGVGSLFRNISAGTITSVTNLASSISRNMDRLSLDSGHQQRQEEGRRHRPVGLADGIRQGLTGFGISLLGAVAGIADHPIQTLLGTEGGGILEERRGSSTSATASGLVTGLGKGLVGVLTKPIGGAAEFVSQTGQGLLHGTGLGQLPCRLEEPYTWSKSDHPEASFKCLVKVLPSLATPCLLFTVPAMTSDLSGVEVRVQLLLTPDALVVLGQPSCQVQQKLQVGSKDAIISSKHTIHQEEEYQQVLPLTEIDCGQCSMTKTSALLKDPDRERAVLVVRWNDQVFLGCRSVQDSHNSSKDRVAAFIDTQAGQNMAHVHFEVDNEMFDNPIASAPTDSPLKEQPDIKDTNTDYSQVEESRTDASAKQSYNSDKDASVVMSPEGPSYEFVINREHLSLFLAVYRLAKSKVQGKGFPV